MTFRDINGPPARASTEEVEQRYAELDAWPLDQAVEAMWEGQMAAVAAVRPALAAIASAAESAAARLGESGRLVFIGAGTSGRVAVQDGAELTPTFDWPRERVVYLLAGGDEAVTRSVEGAEDDEAEAVRRIDAHEIGAADVAIGVAASGTTPFTVAAVERARACGALTVGLASNLATPLLTAVEHPILLATGSEVIAGSTRMKAGTAQKVALNLLSSAIMLRLGRVYRGMMVNMHVSNAKLRRRAAAMVAHIAGCDEAAASDALAASGGEVKRAVLVVLGATPEEAEAHLAACGGNLRLALARVAGGETR